MQSKRSSRIAAREAVTASGTVQLTSSTTSATEERRSHQCFGKEMLKQSCYFAIQLQICRHSVKKAVFDFLF